MLTCFDVADYFLSKGEENGDLISNLKLQKLAYYAQGFSLVLLGKTLFDEPIEAWMHGPVVPDLYHKYKEYGNQGLPVPGRVDFERFSDDERDLLDEVFNVYGQFSAWKLRNMSHEESPWQTTYVEGESSKEIDPGVMAEFFQTLIH
ncbi:SocA family protein [Citrobacter freundii]|nr:SocA family protein [Citrobacter freundii]